MEKRVQANTNKEKPELIIHIGTPKTGSTSLQRAFYCNRVLMCGNNVFYPVPRGGGRYGYELNVLLEKEAIENKIGTDKNTQELINYNTEKNINKIVAQFRKSNCNKMLISDESFIDNSALIGLSYEQRKITISQCEKFFNESILYKATRLKYLFNEFNVKIVCYLRRQDLYIESCYNQNCKLLNIKRIIGYEDMYTDIYKRHNRYSFTRPNSSTAFFDKYQCFIFTYTCYYNLLSAWADIFGKENIIVKPFEKSQLESGLVRDFFISVLNIEPDKLTGLKEVHVNERISRDFLEYVNLLEKRPIYYTEEKSAKISKKLGNVNKYQNYLTVDERIRLLEYHREGNEKIAREYLGREDGRLFYEEVDKAEPEPYPGLTPEKIAVLDKEFRCMEREFKRKEALRRILPWSDGLIIFFEMKSCAEGVIYAESRNTAEKKLKTYALIISILLRSHKLKTSNKYFDCFQAACIEISELIEMRIISKDDKIIIYGTANWGSIFGLIFKNARFNIIAFADSAKEKWGTEFCGYKIISPEQIEETADENTMILIASSAFEEIQEDLINRGIDSEKIITFDFMKN